MTEGTSLATLPSKAAGPLARIRERIVPAEANMRLFKTRCYCGFASGSALLATTAFTGIHDFLTVSAAQFGILMAAGSGILGTMARVTARIDPELRSSFRRTIDWMTWIGNDGVEDPDRTEIEISIASMASAIEAMTGAPVWELKPVNANVTLSASLEGRMAYLSEMKERWLGTLESRTGAGFYSFRVIIPILTQLVISVSEEFGLDASPLQRHKTGLPGRNRRLTVVPRQDDPTPTSRARLLAAEWLAGDRDQVDILVRLEADAAAGRDLRRLEEAWTNARRAATGDTSEIDRRFAQGADRLAEIVQEAIDLRAETAMQTLDTHVRYVHAKRAV